MNSKIGGVSDQVTMCFKMANKTQENTRFCQGEAGMAQEGIGVVIFMSWSHPGQKKLVVQRPKAIEHCDIILIQDTASLQKTRESRRFLVFSAETKVFSGVPI